MKNIETILPYLCCPETGDNLRLEGNSLVSENHPEINYPIIDNVIRFVDYGNTIGYNNHWENYKEIDVNQKKLEQAKSYINWVFENQCCTDNKLILDIGCGDGNHLPFLPENAIKIALDYSSSVNIVSKRYSGKINNLVILQADASKLPIKTQQVDYIISYSCFNHLPKLDIGINEAKRVLKQGGIIAPWAFGTENSFVYYTFNVLRKIYRLSNTRLWQNLIVYSLIPTILLHKNSTGINPVKNSLKDCAEIISTNLSPEYVHLIYGFSWKDYFLTGFDFISNYTLPCGQKFIKHH